MRDVKSVYRALNKASAEAELDKLEEKWEILSTYFKYPEYERKAI